MKMPATSVVGEWGRRAQCKHWNALCGIPSPPVIIESHDVAIEEERMVNCSDFSVVRTSGESVRDRIIITFLVDMKTNNGGRDRLTASPKSNREAFTTMRPRTRPQIT